MTATVLHGTARLEQDYADLLCRVGVDASIVPYTRSPRDWCQWASGCDQVASVYLDGEDPWTGRRLASADSAPEYCYEHGLAWARRMVDDGVLNPCGEVWTVTA